MSVSRRARDIRAIPFVAVLAVLAVLATSAVLTACGDVVVSTTPDEGRLASAEPIPGSADTIPRDVPASCPMTRPDENSPCSSVGSTCEYGSSPDPRCNATLACEGDTASGLAAWTARAAERCSTRECPVGDVAALDGQPCDVPTVDSGAPTASDELLCTMNDGTCACTTGPDAAHAHARSWVCARPVADCPVARPLAGQACTSSAVCDYGSCLFKRGLRMECRGVWLAGASTTCG